MQFMLHVLYIYMGFSVRSLGFFVKSLFFVFIIIIAEV